MRHHLLRFDFYMRQYAYLTAHSSRDNPSPRKTPDLPVRADTGFSILKADLRRSGIAERSLKVKKAVLFLVSLVLSAGFVYSAPTDEQIRQAAGTLGVPFADLKSFVQSYQPQTTQADVITITSEDLYSAYRANQLRADSQYKNKTVKVTGVVIGVGQNWQGNYYVQLEGQGSQLRVDVYVKPSETAIAAALDPGQTATFIGTCNGYSVPSVRIMKATFSIS
jgi:hypothetical protein